MKTQQNETIQSDKTQACCEENKNKGWIIYQVRTWSRWAFFFLALILIGLFVMGILFDPHVTRILWLSITGILLIVILPLILFTGRWIRQCEGACDQEKMLEYKTESNE